MPYIIPAWKELESKVYRPWLWIPFWCGIVFVLIGSMGFLTLGGAISPDIPPRVAKWFTGGFILAGVACLVWAIVNIRSPDHVRHAAPDVFPDVPKEPVICEGSVVHGRLTH